MTDSYDALHARDQETDFASYGYTDANPQHELTPAAWTGETRRAAHPGPQPGSQPGPQPGPRREDEKKPKQASRSTSRQHSPLSAKQTPDQTPNQSQGQASRWHRLGSCKRLARGEFLYQQGDAIERFYLVEAGVLLLKRFTSDGREQVLEMIGASEPTDMAFAGAYDHSAEAANDVVVRVISFAELQRSPDMLQFLLSAAQDRARSDRDHIFMLGRLTAEQRLARFLLHLVSKLAVPSSEGDAGSVSELAVLRFIPSRQQVADFTGLTLETVSRQLSQWRKDGRLEEQRGKSLRLADLEFFQGLANV